MQGDPVGSVLFRFRAESSLSLGLTGPQHRASADPRPPVAAAKHRSAGRQTEAKPQAFSIAGALPWRESMKLMTYYIALSLIGDVIAVFLCLAIEKVVPWISMPIFLTLFFAILWA